MNMKNEADRDSYTQPDEDNASSADYDDDGKSSNRAGNGKNSDDGEAGEVETPDYDDI